MFSHVFAIKGSPKTEDGKWVEEDAWLEEHHEEYDASYQEMDMEEEKHVEFIMSNRARKSENYVKKRSPPCVERCTGNRTLGQPVHTLISTRWATMSLK
jgi:hypothetical protein